jgi:hypothetical protein
MHNLENILSLPSLLHSSEKKKISFNENGVYDRSVKHLGWGFGYECLMPLSTFQFYLTLCMHSTEILDSIWLQLINEVAEWMFWCDAK